MREPFRFEVEGGSLEVLEVTEPGESRRAWAVTFVEDGSGRRAGPWTSVDYDDMPVDGPDDETTAVSIRDWWIRRFVGLDPAPA